MLTFIHQQIRFGIETERCSFVDKMNTCMKVTGSEFLFAVYTSRFEIEVAQTEVSGNIQIQFVELVCVIHVCTCAIIESVPFFVVCEGKSQLSVHSVHLETYIQFVFIRETE